MRNEERRINHGGHRGHGGRIRCLTKTPCSPCTPWLNILAFLISLSSFLILLSCQDPLSVKPSTIPDGKGSFSLSVNMAGAGRTIMPDNPEETDFVLYTLDFKPSSGDTVSVERIPADLGDAVYLDTGTYTLTVTAYLDAEKNKPAAQGSETITINAGQKTTKAVKLSAIIKEGEGTFSYDVIFTTGLKTAGVTIAKINETVTLHAKSFLLVNDSTTTTYTEKVTLDAGYYNVVFTFVKQNGDTLIWRELLHIYSGLESEFEIEFYDADFYLTRYTVIFNFDGGSGDFEGEQSVLHGGTLDEPEDPTRNGYEFGGWYSDPALTIPYAFGEPVTGNITLYAKWNTIPVTSVSLNKTTLALAVGGTETLTATVQPTTATNQNVAWTISPPGIATVSNGAVTAVAPGTATITVTTSDGNHTADCAVTVSATLAAPSNLSISGATLTWNAVANASNYRLDIDGTEYTANTNSYSLSGLTTVKTYTIKVRAIGNGTTYLDSAWSSAIDYTVTIPVTGVTLNKTTLSLALGGTETLTATVQPTTATNQNVTWTISPPGIATVSNGTVTAIGGGTAIITVTTADGSKTATCTVTVTVPATIIITINPLVDEAPNIEGGIISRSGIVYPKTLPLIVTGSFESYRWSIDANVIANGPNVSSFTVDANEPSYNSFGRHTVQLLVFKDGTPYAKTIFVEIVP